MIDKFFRWAILLAVLGMIVLILSQPTYMHGAQLSSNKLTSILDLLRSGSGPDVLHWQRDGSEQGAWQEDDTSMTFNRHTVLLVGVDQRPEDKSIGNTDTLLVVTGNLQTQELAVLSIPRDTMVQIDGYGTGKINSVARRGSGLRATVEAVEQLIGQPIDGYVLTNFEGFKQIIDVLGGITVTVEKDMYHITGDTEDGVIDLRQGTQRLNGDQALQYVRFRNDQLADIGRIRRQQTVIGALGEELLQTRTLAKLPQIIPELYAAVETDLSLGQMLAMSRYIIHLDITRIVSKTLPGQPLEEEGISYWVVDPEESREVIRAIWAAETEGLPALPVVNSDREDR